MRVFFILWIFCGQLVCLFESKGNATCLDHTFLFVPQSTLLRSLIRWGRQGSPSKVLPSAQASFLRWPFSVSWVLSVQVQPGHGRGRKYLLETRHPKEMPFRSHSVGDHTGLHSVQHKPSECKASQYWDLCFLRASWFPSWNYRAVEFPQENSAHCWKSRFSVHRFQWPIPPQHQK